jgi:hypothetical protein
VRPLAYHGHPEFGFGLDRLDCPRVGRAASGATRISSVVNARQGTGAGRTACS